MDVQTQDSVSEADVEFEVTDFRKMGNTWEVLMNLKDVAELSLSTGFPEELVYFLECKITEHRDVFQKVFTNEKLWPKHDCTDVWTMHFERKHKFFKNVVQHTHMFKSIAFTLAFRHH